MSTNFIQEGKSLNHTPSGVSLVSGQFILIGAIGAIALTDIADGKTGTVHVSGVFSVPKATGAITQGAKLYWNSTNSNLTTTATANTIVGIAAAAAASGDANVNILLNIGL